MARILIFCELFEIREVLAQDLAAEGHTVVGTSNPALIQTLLRDLNPVLVLIDLHLNKIDPWKMVHLIRKKSPGTRVLPFAAYTTERGDVRLVISNRDGGENLSFQAFKQKMDIFIHPQRGAD